MSVLKLNLGEDVLLDYLDNPNPHHKLTSWIIPLSNLNIYLQLNFLPFIAARPNDGTLTAQVVCPLEPV